jgi:CRP-like cAMP-binding protein
MTENLQNELEGLPLFADLTGAEINLLVPICRLIRGGIGQYLVHEGDPVRDIYVLLTGEASVRKEHKEIATITRGAVIGEMTLLNHTPAFVTIQAKTRFTSLALDQAAFNRLLEQHARLAAVIFRKMARTLSLRLMMTDAKLAEALQIPHDYQGSVLGIGKGKS